WDRPGEAHERLAAHQPALSPWRRKIAAMLRKPGSVTAELVFLARSLSVLRRVDVLIVSGSGQLLDSWGGTWEYPYTILKWAVLARLCGTRCCFLNVGAGPLQRPLSRRFIRYALRLAHYVAFRDEPSRALARDAGYSGSASVMPDSVYSFDRLPVRTRDEVPGERPVVGLAPMAYCDPRRYYLQDSAAYQLLLDKLASFGVWLSDQHR